MMLGVLIILALIGLLALLALAVVALSEPPPGPPEPDLAAIYREGLHASVRLQSSALDLEQQIWAEAARHADAEGTVASDERQP